MLALDWDQKHVYLVQAQVGRGGVQVERAAQWHEDADLTPAGAAEAGARLRERLREAGISAAPIVICLGRDRVILKDLRFPPVPPAEEPALVRFQASKDLSEGPDEVVIDYQIVDGAGGSDRRAMAVIVRKEVLTAYQSLCRAAGVRLAGMSPRPVGLAGAVLRASGAAATTAAVLTLGERYAELAVVQGRTVLFARSLARGPGLAAEVKRSLVVYAGASAAQQPMPAALHVAGNGEHAALREQLQGMIDTPVVALDPFAGDPAVDVPGHARGSFTGAVGLLHLLSEKPDLPINFTKPKEPKQVSDPAKWRFITAASLIFFLLVAGFAYGRMMANVHADERDRLADTHRERSDLLKKYDADADDVAGFKEWKSSTIPWIDELYDLTARMDPTKGFRITHVKMELVKRIDVAPGLKKAPGKDGPPTIGQVTVKGQVPRDKTYLVDNFAGRIRADKHCQVTQGPLRALSKGQLAEFSLKIDLSWQAQSVYLSGEKMSRKGGGR